MPNTPIHKAARLIILRASPAIQKLGLTERARLFGVDRSTAWRDIQDLPELETRVKEISKKIHP